jgi:hypothetical protein
VPARNATKSVGMEQSIPTGLLDDFTDDANEIGLENVGLGLDNLHSDALPVYLSLSSFIRSVRMRCRSPSVVNLIVTESPGFSPLSFAMKSLSL